jgi:hypothetical protein
MGGRTPDFTWTAIRSGATPSKGKRQVMSSHMNTPKAYMSLEVVLAPPVSSSGADHARVVAILPPPADAVIAVVAITTTAPPKSHN